MNYSILQHDIDYLNCLSNQKSLVDKGIANIGIIRIKASSEKFIEKWSFPLSRIQKNPFSKLGGIYLVLSQSVDKGYIGHGLKFRDRKSDLTRNIKNFFFRFYGFWLNRFFSFIKEISLVFSIIISRR